MIYHYAGFPMFMKREILRKSVHIFSLLLAYIRNA